MSTGEWRASASCAQVDPELWFPENGGSHANKDAAVRICLECPVKRECAEFAVANHIHEGIWGAKVPTERATYGIQGPKTECLFGHKWPLHMATRSNGAKYCRKCDNLRRARPREAA